MSSRIARTALRLALCVALLAPAYCKDSAASNARVLPFPRHGRGLLQETPTSGALPLVTPASDGGLTVGNSFQTEILGSTLGVDTVNYDVLSVPNDGTAATDTIHGAGCLDVAVFAPTAGTSVTSLVVTTASLTAALSNGLFLDETQLVTVPGSNQTNQNITGTVNLTPATLYNLLLLGPVNGPAAGYTPVQLNFTIYPVGAPECAAASPAPATSAASPASAAVPYSPHLVFSDQLNPLSVDAIGFTGATCIAFELLQEISSGVTDVPIDLSAFVVTVEDFANFTVGDQPTFTSLSGVCRQTSTSLGSCTSIAANLNPNEIYVLLAVNGLYTAGTSAAGYILPVGLRYAALASGACDITFPAIVPAPGTAPSTGPSAAGPTALAAGSPPAQAPASSAPVPSPAAAVPSPPPATATSPPASPTTSPATTTAAPPPFTSGAIGGFSTGAGGR